MARTVCMHMYIYKYVREALMGSYVEDQFEVTRANHKAALIA